MSINPASRRGWILVSGAAFLPGNLRLALFLLAGLLAAWQSGAAPPDAAGWRPFEGTWSASGDRVELATGGQRGAAIVHLSGAVVLTGGEALSRGFAGEAIGFDDGASLTVGRVVFTDEKGDRIFSELKGGTLGTGRRFTGTITGGTGRYADLTGEYTFEWQYVVQAETGRISGRAVHLKGKCRRGGPAPEGSR